MVKLKKLLKEVTATGAASTFIGRAGQEVDDIFAGGYHPDSGHGSENIKLLSKQLDDRTKHRKEMEDLVGKDNVGEPSPVGGYYDINTPELIASYEYLTAKSIARMKYNAKITPDNDPRWKYVDSDYWKKLVDARIKTIEDMKLLGGNFINTTEDEMQSLPSKIEYDKIEDKTEENKKFINDTNDWKSIYDSKER